MDTHSSTRDLVDPIAERLGYLLRRASSTTMATLGDALSALALRPVEGTILILVGANPGCTQSDLGRLLGIQRANMAPLIAALTAKGFLAKAPADGRSISLSLTDAGIEARAKVEQAMDAHEAAFARLLSQEDLAALRTVLAKLVAADG